MFLSCESLHKLVGDAERGIFSPPSSCVLSSNFGWVEGAGGVLGMLSAYARIGTSVTRLDKYGLQQLGRYCAYGDGGGA